MTARASEDFGAIRSAVLLVDDQDAQLLGMASTIADLDIEILTARSGAEALATASQRDLALVVLDVAMPGMTGIEAAARLRQVPRSAHVPVMFLTANAAMESRLLEGYAVGGVDYLLKPVDPNVFRSKVSVFAALHRQGQRLRASEEAHRAIGELTADFAFSVAFEPGTTPRLDWATDALYATTKRSREQLQSEGWEQLVHPDDRATTRARLDRVLAGEAQSAEIRIVPRGSEPRTVRVLLRPVWDSERGRVTRLWGAAQDVTAQRQLEAELRELHVLDSVGRLVGGIAHQFNNMLTVINGNAALALEESTGASTPDALRDILVCGERAAGLTQQLLAFGRRQRLVPERLDPNALLTDMRTRVQAMAGERIEVKLGLMPDPPEVIVDREQLEQAIIRLVENAIEAMPAGGRLTLFTEELFVAEDVESSGTRVVVGPHVAIGVSDTGCGLSSDTKARIFEPFFSTKSRPEHAGLGLSSVHGFVHQSGGHVRVDSELGEGASFRICLPAIQKSRPAFAPHAIARPASAGTPRSVLVVEEETAVRRFVSRVLVNSGFTALVAGSPETAERVCAEHPAPLDLLLTDVMMSRMSGPSLAHAIRPFRPNIKVLYMSGYSRSALVHQGVLSPDVPFLAKPFSAAQITRRVRDVLEGRSGFDTREGDGPRDY